MRNFLRSIMGIAGFFFILAAQTSFAAEALPKELDCLIEPNSLVSLTFPLSGLVSEVKVDRGDFVKRGQILARLESRVERSNVAIARARLRSTASIELPKARLALGTRRLDMNRKLYKSKIISSREMDDFKATKKIAALELREALESKVIAKFQLDREMAALSLRAIRSPFDGVIVERLVSPGEFANQSPILKVAQIDPLRVEVFVPISMFNKIRVGMVGVVSPEGPFKAHYRARVTVVDTVVDASSGTFGVRLSLPNAGFQLPAGVKCKVRFPDTP